ncbi:MAG: barstar family protein [Bacteroidales bacterium]|nr:barstar family protein [Bacteroidales bacterium]
MANWKWDRSYDEDESLDWTIIRNGPIVKYFSSDILEQHIVDLKKMRYQVVDVSVSTWTKDNAHRKIREAFDFPEYYGENSAAFGDCLDDMFNRKYIGLVIVFRHFDNFYSKEQDFSEALLDSIFGVTWAWLLTGQKLITIIQCENPDFETNKVGGFVPSWNGWEWLNSRREKKK